MHLWWIRLVSMLVCVVTVAGLPATARAQARLVPQVVEAVRVDESRPMRDIVRDWVPRAHAADGDEVDHEVPNIFPETVDGDTGADALAAARPGVQRAPSGVPAPPTLLSFDGGSRPESGPFIPPDTNGDVSPDHFIQWVNLRWSIYDRETGARVSGPTDGNSFWAGFGGPCEETNQGDPIVLWDDRAERWLVSQFIATEPFAQCFAVSTSRDPLGSWYRYEFPSQLFGDYPHLGVWTDTTATQDAYLLLTHDFFGSSFEGASFVALERDAMLSGLAARLVRFTLFRTAFGALPVHLEGPLAAPAESCPVFTHFDKDSSEYLFWNLCLDWSQPTASTVSNEPVRVPAGAPFITSAQRVAQPGAGATLATFGNHLMYRASARAFAANAPTPMALAVNHYVRGGDNNGGIKWVQFNLKPPPVREFDADGIFDDSFESIVGRELVPGIADEGTFAPDPDTRWLGAIAIDRSGNLGLGYSVGSATLSAELRFTGRALGDAVGTLRNERNCSPGGTGSQLDSSGRWGDYASMSLDPTDECTFWFTSEYYATSTLRDWNTRICTFRFPGCGEPTFDLVAESPTRLEACGTAPLPAPRVEFRIGVLDVFTAPVNLSVPGLPAGVTPQFMPSIIAPTPGTSTLTLEGAPQLPAGEYAGNVIATSGAITRSEPISIGVSTSPTAAPALVAPADGASGIKIRPKFVWQPVTGALDYRIEIATDSAFSSIVASATLPLETTEFETTLSVSTQYFWRVRPRNYCGDGANSVTRSFTTGVPGQCPAGTTLTLVFVDDFDRGADRWTAGGTGPLPWMQQTAPAGIGLSTTIWRVPNNPLTSDQTLISPNITLPAGAEAVILSFDAYHSFETNPPSGCWDGAAVEAKPTADMDWQYLGAERIFTNTYNGTIAAGAPLAGRQAWCYTPTDNTAQRTIGDLDSFRAQTIQLRFRATSDSNTVAMPTTTNGLSIDNLRVDACLPAATPSP